MAYIHWEGQVTGETNQGGARQNEDREGISQDGTTVHL